MQRLASGQRVNSARDDAAGMAIGAGLESQRRGLMQVIRNTNDVRGFLNTAEGALGVQTDLIQRMRELALQSANGTLSDQERSYLNTELQQILKEFARVAEQSEFNGVKLLDGNFGTKSIQVGTSKNQTIELSLPSLASSKVFTTTEVVGNGKFNLPDQFPTVGSGPAYIVAKDFNGDGHLDFVTSEQADDTLSVVLGNGDGTFAARITLGTDAAGSGAIASDDLNGDGYLDIISADQGNRPLSVFYGQGDGTFQARRTIAIPTTPFQVMIADINNDGKKDIIGGRTGERAVILGNGNGTYQTAVTSLLDTSVANCIADVNGDGNIDFIGTHWVYPSAFNAVTVSLGNGDGTFQARVSFALDTFDPHNISAADLNEDGKIDLLVGSNNSGGQLKLLFGNGDGTFQSPTTFVTTSGFVNDIQVADINSDGHVDVISSEKLSVINMHVVGVAFGNGNGTFTPRKTYETTGLGINRLALGDFNSDGVTDIMGTKSNSTAAFFMEGKGTSLVDFYGISISTQSLAQSMLDVFDGALEYINSARANLGALQSRLDFAQAVSENTVENISFAKSQILDADIAVETAEFTRLQILQKAGITVLSQANLNNTLALQLLNTLRA